MTTKALAKSAGALVRLTDGLTAKNGQLVQSNELIEAMALADSLQKDLDEFWGSVKTFMEVNKVTEAKGEWGYLTLTSARRLAAGKNAKPRFLKPTVNTKIVRAYQELHNGKLPAGITETTSTQLRKKVNL